MAEKSRFLQADKYSFNIRVFHWDEGEHVGLKIEDKCRLRRRVGNLGFFVVYLISFVRDFFVTVWLAQYSILRQRVMLK